MKRALIHYLARYAELVLRGMADTKPPLGWTPQTWLHPSDSPAGGPPAVGRGSSSPSSPAPLSGSGGARRSP